MTARIAVENRETRLGEWLWLEYKHAAELDPSLAFTNLPEGMAERLSALAECRAEPVGRAFRGQRLLVLDPTARSPLASRDFNDHDVVVVGGILGEAEPRARTRALITRPLRAPARHLGRAQLPIDVAVLVANLIRLGSRLEEIEIATEVEIVHDEAHSTVLPYGYPVVDGKVLITPGLVEHIRRH